MTATQRIFEITVILDYGNGKVRLLKRVNKKRLKSSEIPLTLKIKMNIPEKIELYGEGEITLNEENIKKISIGQL